MPLSFPFASIANYMLLWLYDNNTNAFSYCFRMVGLRGIKMYFETCDDEPFGKILREANYRI